MTPVRFPTKPPHPAARPFIAMRNLFVHHHYVTVIGVILIAFLVMLAVVQALDAMDAMDAVEVMK